MKTKKPYPFSLPENKPDVMPHVMDIKRLSANLGVDLTSGESIAASIPFTVNDVTAGSEC